MKQIFLFVIMVAVICLSLVGNAAEVERPGLKYRGLNPWATKQALDPKADYTNGIAPAIGEDIRNSNRHNGNNGSNANTVQTIANYNYMNGAASNSSNYEIVVEFVIAYFPGRIDAQQIMSSTGVFNIPGYETLSVRIPKKSEVKITLKPGYYDVRVYRISGAGRKLVRNDILHVDVNPGRYKNSKGETHDFIFYY